MTQAQNLRRDVRPGRTTGGASAVDVAADHHKPTAGHRRGRRSLCAARSGRRCTVNLPDGVPVTLTVEAERVPVREVHRRLRAERRDDDDRCADVRRNVSPADRSRWCRRHVRRRRTPAESDSRDLPIRHRRSRRQPAPGPAAAGRDPGLTTSGSRRCRTTPAQRAGTPPSGPTRPLHREPPVAPAAAAGRKPPVAMTPEVTHAKKEIAQLVKNYCSAMETLQPERVQEVFPHVDVGRACASSSASTSR